MWEERRFPQSLPPRRPNPTRQRQELEAFENTLNRVTAKMFMSGLSPSQARPPLARRALCPHSALTCAWPSRACPPVPFDIQRR